MAGLVGEAGASRSGEDSRRRGWFWHWNSVVTQYAPLIGLKGVGLLNSYTVWTDRREESPHRGYAFPSQQSEADFYGEDRAELIAINKILVALDLIEIRKEMILKADEKGRRWRVPHNFYRVKDHDDGFTLSTKHVLGVVALAERDPTVYRYVRRVFSSRFAPIGPDNVWHKLLPELRQHPSWQRLATRATAEEERASARTRAGHAARGRGTGASQSGDGGTIVAIDNDTDAVTMHGSETTSVEPSNTGSEVDVARTNRGSTLKRATSVEPTNSGLASVVPPANRGPQTAVGPSNTMYDDGLITTTTTSFDQTAGRWVGGSAGNERGEKARRREGEEFENDTHSADALDPADSPTRRPADPLAITVPSGETAAGPGERPAPADAPSELAAARAFEDANARAATPAERKLLNDLARRFDGAAVAAGGTGWGWVAAAIYEAVAAGSAFVAPRRISEILARWERDGLPEDGGSAGRRVGGERDGQTGRRADGKNEPATLRSTPADPPTRRLADPGSVLGDGPELMLPHGHGSRRTWQFVVGLLAGALEPERLVELVAGTAIVGYRDGEVTIAAPDPVQAERLATTHRDLVTRKLSEALRRPVRLAVLTTESAGRRVGGSERIERRGDGETGRRGENEQSSSPTRRPADPPTLPVFPVPECGLASDHAWAMVIGEVEARGDVSRANLDTWLRPTALIGRDTAGGLIVGAGSALAQRRIAGRFLPPLRAAVAAVFGTRFDIEVVVARDWLTANPPADNPTDLGEDDAKVGA